MEPPPARVSSYAQLVELLAGAAIPHQRDDTRHILSIEIRSPVAGPLHLRWEKHLPYVQAI
jgi:hypothetical protein